MELSREEFRNNLQTVKVAVEEGSDKRDQGLFNGGQEKHRCDSLIDPGCNSDPLKRMASQGWGWWISLTLAGLNVFWLEITC